MGSENVNSFQCPQIALLIHKHKFLKEKETAKSCSSRKMSLFCSPFYIQMYTSVLGQLVDLDIEFSGNNLIFSFV